jgi:hypothetical protein
MQEYTFIRLSHIEHSRLQGLWIVAFLYGVALDSHEFHAITRKEYLDVNLLSCAVQITELVIAECEILKIC